MLSVSCEDCVKKCQSESIVNREIFNKKIRSEKTGMEDKSLNQICTGSTGMKFMKKIGGNEIE